MPFLLEEWIEILSDHLKEAEAKNQVKLKPRSMFIEFDRKLMLMIRRRGTPRRMYKAFAPIRETPQRVYLHESSIINSRDVRGEHTATRLMKLSQSSEDNWDSLKSDLNEFGRKSGLFEEIYPHALVRKSQYPFEIRLRTKHAQTSNLCDVGYGVSQILPLLVDLILSEKQSGFLIQQPEVHLHPRTQAEFGRLVAGLPKKNRHFVIETHSDFIIERIGHEINKGALDCNDVGILFFEAKDTEVLIHNISIQSDGSPKSAPPSYRKFFLEEFDRLWS